MNTNDIGWIGHYGNMLLAMPKEHNPDRYTSLLFEGTLKEYLLSQDEYISQRILDLTMELAKKKHRGTVLLCSVLSHAWQRSHSKNRPHCVRFCSFFIVLSTQKNRPLVFLL